MKKVLLECDVPRNGFINITSGNIKIEDYPPDTIILAGRSDNLDPVLEDNSVDEMVFNRAMNAVHPLDTIKILQHWYKKLTKDGILLLSFFDIRRVGLVSYSGQPIEELHYMILGNSQCEYKSLIDLDVMTKALKSVGFSIEEISSTGCTIDLVCKKS